MKRKPTSQLPEQCLNLCAALVILTATAAPATAKTYHVWQKIEITLNAEKSYQNPYTRVKDFSGWDGCIGWAYCARTPEKAYFLIYFETYCTRAALAGAAPKGKYKAQWFDPRKGRWIDAAVLKSDENGRITLPQFPGKLDNADKDWAIKLDLLRS